MVKLPKINKKNKNTRNPVTHSPGIIFTKSCFLFNQFFFSGVNCGDLLGKS